MQRFRQFITAAVCTLAVVGLWVDRSSGQSSEVSKKSKSDANQNDIGWSSFRDGGSSSVDVERLPMKWAPGQGIAWEVELEGYGQSSPLIVGDKVLLTAVEGDQKETNLVVCLDRDTGQQQWRASRKSSQTGPSNFMFSRAAPTPVADSQYVYAFFESGDLLKVRLNDGEIQWQQDIKKSIGELKSRHGLGSSLAQTDGLVFANVEHDGPSFLFAINKSDGSIAWKTKRPSGSSWSSPAIMQRDAETQVIVSSAGEVAGYAVADGSEVWKLDGLVGNSVPSPLVVGNRVYLGARKSEFGSVLSSAKSNLCLEFEAGSVKPQVKWRSERCVTDYASPVISGDHVFLVNSDGILGCVDRDTGEEFYRQRLGFKCWATPIVVGDYLFVFGKNGTTTVVQAGDSYEQVSKNQLWDLESPPRPVSYVEHFPNSGRGGHGGHSHGGHSHHGQHAGKIHGKSENQKHASHSAASDSSGAAPRKPGAGMVTGMLERDADGDGMLSGEEIPRRLVAAMENIDLNQDGRLDRSELEKMAQQFAARRKNSRASSRDPIVYGVAADTGGFLIRTGTRLYAIGGGGAR